jgi:integrase
VPAVRPSTANKNTRTLVALWHEAIDQDRNEQPAKRIKPLREDLDALPCWTPDELARLLASSRQQRPVKRLPCPTDAFFLALVLVAYDTASRISAIMAATPADLDWGTGRLTLRAKTTKGRKCKVVGLSDQTLAAVKAIYNPSWAYLFPWPFDRSQRPWRSLTDRLKQILQRAGLPDGRIHLWHKIRRTTATELTIKEGIEAARKHLDHSAESVTRRYLDPRRLDETKHSAAILPRPQIDAGG